MLRELLLITSFAAGVAAGPDHDETTELIDDPATAAAADRPAADAPDAPAADPAASHSPAASPDAPAAGPCGDGARDMVIGYEPGIPPIEAGSGTRAVRVLERAFPPPCFRLVTRAYRREDLGPSVVKGVIDVGVLGIAAAESYAEPRVASLGAAETDGVDTLLLHPASYSVVSTKREAMPTGKARASSPWVAVPAGALMGIVALLAGISLLNLKLPRLDRLFERATRRVDPQLTGFRRTLEWVYGTASGRLFALAWAALGATLAAQELSERALTDESTPEDADYRRGAELAAYPAREVYEFRNQRWKRCPRPFQCLRNYDRGETLALAGDRDVLCQHARETDAGELDFRPDIGVPILYALLLPATQGRPAEERGAGAKSAILAALKEEAYVGSPWRGCDVPIAAAQVSR